MAKMDNGKAAPVDFLKEAVIESLTPDIIQVLADNQLIARGLGKGLVKITLGNLEKIVTVNVTGASMERLLYMDLSQKIAIMNAGDTLNFTFSTGGVNIMSNNDVNILAAHSVNVTGTMSDGAAASSAVLQAGALFESNDVAVATVDVNGNVTAIGEGAASIKVTVDGVETVLTVNVNVAVLTGLVFDQSEITVDINDTITINF